ncbi:hypothetical protein EsH8_IX_000462 [Colletotrichum jinshuiense]
MSGPYSRDIAHLQEQRYPYIFEDDFNQYRAGYIPEQYYFSPQDMDNSQLDQPVTYNRSETYDPENFLAPFYPPPRSTTPESPPPPASYRQPSIFDPRAIPGGFSSKLSATLAIPPSTVPEERYRRQAQIDAIFTSTQPSLLPPPSPRVKKSSPPRDPAVYKIRRAPCEVRLAPLPPKRILGRYIDVSGMPDGPQKEATVAHNNRLAGEKRDDLKRRNSRAAERSRMRKERAIVWRSEELARARAETAYWKARAVASGARLSAWEDLDEGVREGLVADNRTDAMDYSQDEPRGKK